MEDLLKVIDKDIFLKFRDSQITFAQAEARMMERNGVAPFMVLDDFKESMSPDDLKKLEENDDTTFKLLYGPEPRRVSAGELLKPLEDW